MRMQAILIALLAIAAPTIGAPAAYAADASADSDTDVSQKIVLETRLAPAAIVLDEAGTTLFFAFLDEGETPRLDVEKGGVALRIVKGEDSHLTGEFFLPIRNGDALELVVRDMLRETIAPGAATTLAPGVSDPRYASVPDPTEPQPMSYSVAYCQYDQSCVQTRMDEGCSKCIEHWARVTTSTAVWYMYGCDDAHACQVIAGNPGGPWDSGWRCQIHTNPLPWSIKAWTELWKGTTVWASDNTAYSITYFWSRYC